MTVTYMDLDELVNGFAPPIPEQSWYGWMNSYDPIEAEEIETLALELLEDGEFYEPIRLSHAEDEVDKETGEVIHHPAIVLNGCHRLCAHILTNTSPVKVTFDAPVNPEETTIEFYFTYNANTVEEREQLEDAVLSLFRAKVPGHGWMVCSGGGGMGNEGNLYLEVDDRFDPATLDIGLVRQFFVDRVTAVLGDKVTIHDACAFVWDDTSNDVNIYAISEGSELLV